jgi:glycosyltransferase involved in cell wall biosynthesis
VLIHPVAPIVAENGPGDKRGPAMRIVIDARPVADHFPGIGRYVASLLRALAAADHGHELIALTCPGLVNTRHQLPERGVRLVPIAARPFSLAEHAQIPLILRQLRADLYHATYYVRPYVGIPCPSVTTLYDSIPLRFPGAVSRRARLLFRLLHQIAIRASARVLTISESARADLIADFGADPARVSVSHLAADPQFAPQPPAEVARVRATYGLGGRYVLALASNKPHKNLVGLLRAWAIIRRGGEAAQLVVAGHRDPRGVDGEALAEAHGLGGAVQFLPNAPERDLPALHCGAELFVFPSLYEGFGLPPLEAMACGSAVVCGGGSSLPEVVGRAARIVDAGSPESIAAGVAELLASPAARGQLRAAALAQAARFSWGATAAQTLRAYESI